MRKETENAGEGVACRPPNRPDAARRVRLGAPVGLQWYAIPGETAEASVRGLSQGLPKRDLPRALMFDGGAGFVATEMTEGKCSLTLGRVGLSLSESDHWRRHCELSVAITGKR